MKKKLKLYKNNYSGTVTLNYAGECVRVKCYNSRLNRQAIINEWRKLYNLDRFNAYIEIAPR